MDDPAESRTIAAVSIYTCSCDLAPCQSRRGREGSRGRKSGGGGGGGGGGGTSGLSHP